MILFVDLFVGIKTSEAMSNNTLEVEKTLGIEAARSVVRPLVLLFIEYFLIFMISVGTLL